MSSSIEELRNLYRRGYITRLEYLRELIHAYGKDAWKQATFMERCEAGSIYAKGIRETPFPIFVMGDGVLKERVEVYPDWGQSGPISMRHE